MSPAIRHRLVSGNELVSDLQARFERQTVEKLVQEIVWRDYWKGWLEQRPQIWQHYLGELDRIRGELFPSEELEVQAVERGETGVAIMDRFARELMETGYLHNHARMWFASFWVHVRGLPWQLGAAFFYRHLLDADAASNTLSWRWVAGLQTQGKTYLVRRSNLEKFCSDALLENLKGLEQIEDGRVHARLIEEDLDLQPIEPEFLPTDVPAELIGRRAGLLLHLDDLTPELTPLAKVPLTSILALPLRGVDVSQLRKGYSNDALADGLRRAVDCWGCSGSVMDGADEWEAIRDWVERESLSTVITLAPFVGPVRDALEGVGDRLEEMGVRWVRTRRQEDAARFVHAGRGFFPFWKRVSKALWPRP